MKTQLQSTRISIPAILPSRKPRIICLQVERRPAQAASPARADVQGAPSMPSRA
jgi:hypothetical protein